MLAVVLAVLGVALALTALVLTRRSRSTVLTTADGITVEHGRTRSSLLWSESAGPASSGTGCC